MDSNIGSRKGEEAEVISRYISNTPGISKYCIHVCEYYGDCAAVTAALAQKRMTDEPDLNLNESRDIAISIANRCASRKVEKGFDAVRPAQVLLVDVMI